MKRTWDINQIILPDNEKYDILSTWETIELRRLYPSYFTEGFKSPPDHTERRAVQ